MLTEVKKCELCGADFTTHDLRRKYCSPACKAEAQRKQRVRHNKAYYDAHLRGKKI